jgi:hypothetical protein
VHVVKRVVYIMKGVVRVTAPLLYLLLKINPKIVYYMIY